jgi:hypothetical protein
MMQRLTVATFAGKSAAVVAALLRSWRVASALAAVDRFAAALRENGLALPVVYYSEWVDRWLMGDLVPGPEAVQGRRYQVACFSADQALAWAEQCGGAVRRADLVLLPASRGRWGMGGAEQRTVVVLREAFDASTTDEQVKASFGAIPEWLSAF